MTRVAVFLDYQNVYQGARRAFGWGERHFTFGQVHPRRLGLLLVQLGQVVDVSRELEYVRAYRGEPSARHSRTAQAASQRQLERWNGQERVAGITRPLRYYRAGHNRLGGEVFDAREKGIDVLLALDLVMGAMRDEYDVAVVFSGDSDLAPALETVLELGKRCEVAAWSSKHARSPRLRAHGANVWCHWLDLGHYNVVRDPTDYTRPQHGGPAGALA